MSFYVNFYRNSDGTKPAGLFIRSLPVKLKAKDVSDLHLLEEYGNLAREPLSKPTEQDTKKGNRTGESSKS